LALPVSLEDKSSKTDEEMLFQSMHHQYLDLCQEITRKRSMQQLILPKKQTPIITVQISVGASEDTIKCPKLSFRYCFDAIGHCTWLFNASHPTGSSQLTAVTFLNPCGKH
jgi:hypothetical protein